MDSNFYFMTHFTHSYRCRLLPCDPAQVEARVMGNGTLGLFVQLTYMVSAADLAPHLHKVQPFAWCQVPVMTCVM